MGNGDRLPGEVGVEEEGRRGKGLLQVQARKLGQDLQLAAPAGAEGLTEQMLHMPRCILAAAGRASAPLEEVRGINIWVQNVR